MAMILHAHIDLGPPESVTGYLSYDPAAGALDSTRVRPVDDQQPTYNPVTHVAGDRVETIEPTKVVWTYPVTERPLQDVKDDLCARTDQDAGALRTPFTTTSHGQPETYIRKQLESQKVADDASPTAAKYPLLNAGIGPDAPDTGNIATDLKAVGQVVETRATEWAGLAEPIENPRLQGKRNIEAAANVTAAWDAYQAIQWPNLQQIREKVDKNRKVRR